MELSTRSGGRSLLEPEGSRAWQPPVARPVQAAEVIGLGSYAPERVLTNHDLEQIVETSHDWIFTRTGIAERRIAAPDEKTSDLALRAAERALADAGLTGADIDLVIVSTVTGDAPFPATSSIVQDRIGAARAGAFDLAAGCSGFIYGLATGAQFIQSGTFRHVLVIGAETLSRIVNWRDRSTCVLFGDGAGAAVLGPAGDGPGFLSFDLGSDGGGAELLLVEEGGWGHPLATGSEAPQKCSIRMSGNEVFKFAVRVIEESTRRALDRAGLSIEEIDLFVPHQANIRIIDAAAKRLGLDESRTFNNVDKYGNTSAASIPLALDEARRAGRLHPGDTVALVGFGAGLSWASCVFEWSGPGDARARG